MYYLGAFNGGYSGDQFSETGGIGSSKKGGAGGEAEAAPLTPEQRGEKVFSSNCATCHQSTGQGMPNQYHPACRPLKS